MNRCASMPPLPFALKLVKLWQGKFYLSPDDRGVLAHRIHAGEVSREEEAVEFVDDRGEWLE